MRFVTCRLPDGMEDPAILSQDGTQVWPLSWLGLSYETLSDAIPFLTPQVRFGLQLAISGIPALPVEAVTLQSPIPCPAQDVVCLGINYMAHSDEAEKYSADAFSTQHQDAIYFSKRVSRAVPDGGFIEAHTDLVQKLDYECELAVVLGKDAKDVPAGQTKDYVFGYTILNDVSARDVQTAHKQCSAASRANTKLAVIPPAAAPMPPVNTPGSPISSTAFTTPWANRCPNPSSGTLAPAPASFTSGSYRPTALRITPATT